MKNGRTALCYCIMTNNIESVKLLINEDVEISFQDIVLIFIFYALN